MGFFVLGLYDLFLIVTGLLGVAVLYTTDLKYFVGGLTATIIIILTLMDQVLTSNAVAIEVDKETYVQG